MGPNADRRGVRIRAAALALIALLAWTSAELDVETWTRHVTEVTRSLQSADAIERAHAADELAELLLELERSHAEGRAVGTAEARLFAHAAYLLARAGDDVRPAGIAPRALLERACVVTDASGEHGVRAYAALKLGELLFAEGDHAAARSVLRAAAERLDQDFGTRPQIRLTLALIATVLGAPDEALSEVNEADALLAHVDPSWSRWPDVRADVLATRCSLLLVLGNPDRALLDVAELARLGSERGRNDLVARAHVHAARAHLALGRSGDAEREVERALELGATERPTLELVRALARSASGDAEQVRSAEADLVRVVETPGTLATDRERARFALAELALRRGALERAGEVLRAARAELDPEAPEAAFVLTALEAELVLARPRKPAAGGDGEDPFAAAHVALLDAYGRFLAAWDRVPAQTSGVGFLQYASRRRALDALVRTTLAVHGPEAGPARALDELERAQARGSVARAAGYAPRGVDRVRAALVDERRGLVTYLPSHGRTHVFAVDAGRVVHAELPSVRELEPLRRELVATCSSPPDAAAAKAGRRGVLELEAARALCRELWPPAVRAVAQSWTSVRIAGAGSFGYVPFECLPLAADELLGDRLAVSYLPSIPVGVLLEERARRDGKASKLDVVVIAATEPSDDAPLPFAAPQLAALTGAYDKQRVLVFQGAEATFERLSAPELGGARVLQVLAHGVVDFERERTAGFALADRSVWCDDVEGARAPPLVCLWVCNAGQGPLRRGEDGLATLGDAYLASGALAVIVSPARIEYRAVLDLARTFHERLARFGDTPDEALRRARAALASDPERAHPFFSLVHVVGLGDVQVFGR